MNTTDHSSIIEARRAELGKRLCILAHHYQSDEIVRHADHVGDSLELARLIPGLEAEYIVFCGVDFMAEAAAVLAKPGQKVLIPEEDAFCVMSMMAPAKLVGRVVERLSQTGRRVVPLAYVNTHAAVKALCGRHGGAICTSANAKTMLEWARRQGDGVLFLPDKNLAWNTADVLGIPEESRMIIDVRGGGEKLDLASTRNKELLVWPGSCAIHDRFKPEHVRQVRAQEPEAKVVVHPECSPEVVRLADASGSTSRIIAFVESSPSGSSIVIGTEINLVDRLAKRHASDKAIRPLLPSLCRNMAKNTAENLAGLLQVIEDAPTITVDPGLATEAKLALDRMLEACR